MPTYNYYCNKCDQDFSYFQKMSEKPVDTCENCGGNIERIITGGTGLIFKGSGFYLTDYKNSSKSKDKIDKTAKESQNNLKNENDGANKQSANKKIKKKVKKNE